jgi:ribonuclease HI
MACSGKGGASRARSAGRNGSSETRSASLTVAQVLERFDGGPDHGVFTDGSCQGNPGPGGWGVVWVDRGEIVEERNGYEPSTTNNRMELRAIIEGLAMLPSDIEIDLYTDSRLMVDTLTKWAAGWEKRGWRRKDGEVKNLELVQEAYALIKKRPGVHITWIRAHDGSRWNEYADALSTAHLRDEL